ncbi:MAG: flagellar basal body P-ring formation chaperone FlgA [Opitutales bacterium]
MNSLRILILKLSLFCGLLLEGTPIQLGSILAPVDGSSSTQKVDKGPAATRVSAMPTQQKVKYEWIHMHDILGRLESMLVSEIDVDDQVSLASRSHWDPVKIKAGSSWDLTLTNPFIPDARGRWYPSIELFLDGISKVKRRLTVNVALYRELWQVDQQLKQGDLLDSAHLVPTVRDIYSLNIVAIPRNELLEGFELVRAVNAGSLLKWSDVRKQPAVRRNSLVDVFAQTGGITIRMRGRCMENGVIGEYVTVRNLETNREFNAHVLGTGLVKYEL